MTLASDLEDLKQELQALKPVDFEHLIAALISELIGVGITVAKSGFQHGGDAGTSGRQGRRLRIETKRYADTNPLSERELLGELQQAHTRDGALELWILAATKAANEQLEQSLLLSGEEKGVPVLIIDWKDEEEMPALAALCASAPEVVEKLATAAAGRRAAAIASSPEAPWLSLHQQLQAGPFAGHIRVLAGTRPLFFENRLHEMRGLVLQPVRVPVGPYDLDPDGEFDRMLASKGLTRSRLREELIPSARVPRLFDLVIRLRDRLQDVERITVHTLLWEYGRDTLGIRGERAFSEVEWQEWLVTLAGELRTRMSPRFTRAELETLSARPTLDPGDVLARLSDIVDSPLSKSDASKRVILTPTLVDHALGLALLSDLAEHEQATPAEVQSRLEAWLGPISGLAEREEILRAAVSILSATAGTASPAVANALVASWLSTQNLPDTHRRDVLASAADVAEPLLHVVETLGGFAFRAARALAVDALRSVPRSNDIVRGAVREATTRWMSVISRDVQDGVQGSEDFERSRAKRMVDRVGVDADGPLTLFGRTVEFVARPDGTAFGQVPPLIEGYPLASFIDMFELAALHFAVRGRLDAWASLKWLTLRNEQDFEETAAALAKRADEVVEREAEPGVEPRLRQRTASLLLCLSQVTEHEERASKLDPGLDRWRSYEDHYEADPAASMFTLERRHAGLVLADPRMAGLARAQRLEHFWWDPALVIPSEAAADLAAAGDAFEIEASENWRFQTPKDDQLEKLMRALAAADPTALARLVRRRIEALATHDATRPMLGALSYDALLVGDQDSDRLLRDARPTISISEREGDEDGVAQLLLQAELIDLDGEAQVDAIIEAELRRLFNNINPFLKPIPPEATDRLVKRHGDKGPPAIQRLVQLFGDAAENLGQVAAPWVERVAFGEANDGKIHAFELLARCRPDSFGARLVAEDWSWNQETDYLLAHFGSIALIRGAMSTPFEAIAARIAPWLLPYAVRERGSAAAEARLAAEILDPVIRRVMIAVPDPGSPISIHLPSRESDPFILSLTQNPLKSEDANPLEELRAALDQAAREEAGERAVRVALERIGAARQEGASLYLTSVNAEDLVPLILHAGDVIDGWLEGMDARSDSFRHRVQLAEGFFVGLCEAMMRVNLDCGISLWNAVRASLHTRFLGEAGIDKMILMLLRAPADDRIDNLVRDLIAPQVALYDDVLLDIAVAAAAAERSALLDQLAAEDRDSRKLWRIERARTLEAFSPGEGAPSSFPDGLMGASEHRAAACGQRRYRDHAAHHWWDRYWNAPDGETAYASWLLLEASVDRRAIEWIERQWPARQANRPLMARKFAFAAGRRGNLKSAAQEQDKKLNKQLYGREIVDDISPWARFGPVNEDDS